MKKKRMNRIFKSAFSNLHSHFYIRNFLVHIKFYYEMIHSEVLKNPFFKKKTKLG